MVNEDQLRILNQGNETWNKWRRENPDDKIDLRGADLNGVKLGVYPDISDVFFMEASGIEESKPVPGVDLSEADLSRADLRWGYLSGADLHKANLYRTVLNWADLRGANLIGANLYRANFSGANLSEADLSEADIYRAYLSEQDREGMKIGGADLSGANLSKANLYQADLIGLDLSRANLIGANLYRANLKGTNLRGADLSRANFSQADLNRADLSEANIIDTNLSAADLSKASLIEATLVRTKLTGCIVYGISAWGLMLDNKTEQKDLIITPHDQPTITVDNIEVAQFVYLLLNNKKIRDVIDTVANKAALILGRFTPERKIVLDALKDELRKLGYLPILFDFEKPKNQDIAQTVSTLAHMARFIIADITDAKSIPAELQLIVPNLPLVPVAPIILESDYEFALFERIMMFNSVLKPYRYKDQETLLISIAEKVIKPVEEKRAELKKMLNGVRNGG